MRQVGKLLNWGAPAFAVALLVACFAWLRVPSPRARVTETKAGEHGDREAGAMKLIANIASWTLTALAVLLLAGFIAWFTVPRLLGLEPQVVLSGSMEPAMPTGSVVFVKDKDAARVRPGDILTFRNPDNPQQRVTHRVTEVVTDANGLAFLTKGDANEAADQWLVPAANVVGTVEWTVPHMGRVTRRVQTPQGFLLVIGLPAAMLIAAEIHNIGREVRKGREQKEALS